MGVLEGSLGEEVALLPWGGGRGQFRVIDWNSQMRGS